ncbi:MAG: DUF4114 domain-containing protein [Opitutaceae bacterium]|nr:DUF4114 domain-containing protein [Verrucomicrobiales bacterium]
MQGPGGDTAANSFMSSLPAIDRFLAAQYRAPNLGEGHAFSKPGSHQVDPLDLTMGTAFSARAYFIGERAGYRNQLGFNSTGSGGPLSSQPGSLMFSDASTTPSVLSPGSWVDLGIFAANTQLHFFLIADGVNKPRGTYSTKNYTSAAQAAADGVTYDRFQHAIEFEKSFAGHNYVFIGFEDIRNGGDRDYNDSIFALELLPDFGGALPIPEPGTWVAAALALTYLGISIFRRPAQKLVSV